MSTRNEELPDGDPRQCSQPGCSIKRRVLNPVPLCSKHNQAHRRSIVDARTTLPEDGIVDFLAVEIAAKGMRPVRLTKRERLLAAALILAQNHESPGEVIMGRLNVSRTSAWRLIDCLSSDGNTPLNLSVCDDEDVNYQQEGETVGTGSSLSRLHGVPQGARHGDACPPSGTNPTQSP